MGGSGLSRLDATLVFEVLTMTCPSVSAFLSIHNMCGSMIDRYDDPGTRATWLPRLCQMDLIFSYCLTEPGSGSDAAALRNQATLALYGRAKTFGKTIDQFQALQFKLADMEVKLQAARSFLRQAAWKLDMQAPDATKFCAMEKFLVTDSAFESANQCLQLHDGYGYLIDYGIEKIVRDLRFHQILKGTNEIMRMIIARQMLADR